MVLLGLGGPKEGFKMILSHRAPSSFNMSAYRAIWTHFRQSSVIFMNLILQTHFKWLASGIGSR